MGLGIVVPPPVLLRALRPLLFCLRKVFLDPREHSASQKQGGGRRQVAVELVLFLVGRHFSVRLGRVVKDSWDRSSKAAYMSYDIKRSRNLLPAIIINLPPNFAPIGRWKATLTAFMQKPTTH